MFISKVSGFINEVLELKTDVLSLVDSVKQQLDQDSNGSALLLIYQHFDGSASAADSQAIAALIDSLSMPEADLRARFELLRPRLLARLPEPAQRLLKTLTEEPEPLKLPIQLEKSAQRPLSGDITFTLGGTLGAELAIAALNGQQASASMDLPITAGDAVLSVSADGEIGLHGAIGGAIPAGSISFAAQSSARARANLLYQFSEDTPVISGLIEAGQNRALPWKLDQLEQKLAAVGAGGDCTGLRRAQLHINGELDVGGSIAVGRVWSHRLSANLGDGRVESVALKAQAGASFGFSLRREGQFALVAEKDADGKVVLALTKSGGTRFGRTIEVGAQVEITGLDKIARPYVADLFTDPKDLLGKLDQWANPGDLVLNKLRGELATKGWRRDLGKLLLGDSSADDVAGALGAKVARRISELLNERVPYWGRSDDDVATELVERLADSLGVSGEIRGKAEEKLKPKLVKALSDLTDDLEQRVEQLIKRADDDVKTQAKSILAPFDQVGKKVKDVRDLLNQGGNKIVAPAKELLIRYQKYRGKVIEGLDKAAKLKVGMAYLNEVQKTREQSALLSLRVLKVNARTKALFWALATGKIGHLWPELLAAEAAGEIDGLTGRFDALARAQRSSSFSIQFLDWQLLVARDMSSEIDVSVDPIGNVVVAKGSLSQMQTVSAFGVTRKTGAAGAYQLSNLLGSVSLPEPVAVTVSIEEKEGLRASELDQFLGSFESSALDQPLLAAGATARAVAAYKEAIEASNTGATSSRVDVGFALDLAALRRLRTEVTADHAYAVACDQLLDLTRGDRREGLEQLAGQFRGGVDPLELIKAVGGRTEATALRILRSGGIASDTEGVRGRVIRLVDQAKSIHRKAEQLKRVVQAIQRLTNEWPLLVQQDPTAVTKDAVDLLDEINEEIQGGMSAWLKARLPFSGIFTERVPAHTLALLAMLARLTEQEQTQLIPVVTTQFGGRESKVLVT